jgi:signal transduction histidine kinase
MVDNKIVLRVPDHSQSLLWIFSFQGVSDILSERTGLGKTGEIYLVGTDHWIRSASRHLDENKTAKVSNDSFRLGSQEKFGVHKVKDYRNMEVLSAYSPFRFDELKFVILSEIDRDEVVMPLSRLFPSIYIVCLILFFASLGLALYSGRKILNVIDEMRERINSLHLQLITMLEEDKREISFNLHDGVGQIITALKWGIGQKQEPEELKQLCDRAVAEIRLVSNNLMPPELSTLGLFAALSDDFRKKGEFYKLNMTFWYNDRLNDFTFIKGLDVNIYRMVQELVQNTVKHSGADTISLVIFREKNRLVLRYEDNGKGMSDDDPMPRVLQYRGELIGAMITRTNTGKGLIFKIEIPTEKVFHEAV